MANLNKVMLIGRLTRDPESRMFANGGKVTKFGFAVDGARKKNPSTGQWESEPCFLDCEAFNRGETGKTADLVEQYLRKGSQAYVEGHLVLNQWTTQDGQKRSQIRVVVDNVQFLDSKQDGGAPRSSGGPAPRRSVSPPQDGMPEENYDGGDSRDSGLESAPPGQSEDIPF